MLKKVEVFISYCHKDETILNKLLGFIKLLDSINIWYDRYMSTGDELNETILKHLNKSDIMCSLVSPNYLNSKTCMKEFKSAQEQGKKIVPIILTTCPWQDSKFQSILATPKDGQPIDTFQKENEAYQNIYDDLKHLAENIIQIKDIKVSEEFNIFLESADILAKSHSQKETLFLKDLFVPPELCFYDIKERSTLNFNTFLEGDFTDYRHIMIVGENLSGKTTLCKKLFIQYASKGFFPVYLSPEGHNFSGKIQNKIEDALKQQYLIKKKGLKTLPQDKIIPILDDFYEAKNQSAIIEEVLEKYDRCVIIVDDLYGLNINHNKNTDVFKSFEIQPFQPSLRYQLIQKWIDNNNDFSDNYESVDKYTDLIDSSLGITLGHGIMPSYPFFIYSVMSSFETIAKPLNEDITSQGYCYQALIFISLSKTGIPNDLMSVYMNVLTHLAYTFFIEDTRSLDKENINSFFVDYEKEYNFPIKKETLKKNLFTTKILVKNSLGFIGFSQQYLYYFFVGKYLSEHPDNDIINNIMANLHKNSNAYIAIFITYHSKNVLVTNTLISNAKNLFKDTRVATLNTDDISFFKEHEKKIISSVLSNKSSSEQNRASALKRKDNAELNRLKHNPEDSLEEDDDNYFRRAIKTVEVIGRVIKNHSGDMRKTDLEDLFKTGTDINLKLLEEFFLTIQNTKVQAIIERNIEQIISEKNKNINNDRNRELASSIFWNINLRVIIGILRKTANDLGSDKLLTIASSVYDSENTPASFILKQNIYMWYQKQLNIDVIKKWLDSKNIPNLAKIVMKWTIIDYISLHHIKHDDMSKLKVLGIEERKKVIK